MTEPKESFRSSLAPLMEAFLDDKRARGFGYLREQYHLQQLDRFLIGTGHDQSSLPRDLVERWLSTTIHRRPSTHRHRQVLVRQFAAFLQHRGCSAYCPALTAKAPQHSSAARIFSRDEMRRILDATDHLPFNGRSPLRHLVMAELFRILYGCGLRVGEVLRLTVADVDLAAGLLRIRAGKFHKDRLVPVAPALRDRLRKYAETVGARDGEQPFFPSPRGGAYDRQAIYQLFRHLLDTVGIRHGGRGHGPRLHEIRHSFAVHRLEQWYRAGENLNAKLPLLATYMGHRSMIGTQWYLQLTRSLFTDLATRLDQAYGHVVPGESAS